MVGIKFFKPVLDFLFPEHCLVCEQPLISGEKHICSFCINHLPFTELDFDRNNPVAQRLKKFFPVYKATSLMFYHSEGSSGKLIQDLKYHNRPEIGEVLAFYLAPKLATDPPGIIIPIPLHKKKLKIRGYNQLEKFGKKLARSLQATYRDDVLIKTSHTESQTRKSPVDRWKNVKETFRIGNISDLENKHILLVDDVLTTGATLSAAASVIYENLPRARISVAVMAFKKD